MKAKELVIMAKVSIHPIRQVTTIFRRLGLSEMDPILERVVMVA